MKNHLWLGNNVLLSCGTCRNVLQDEAGRLKVTDFGLSKIAQEKDVLGYKMTGRTGSCKICNSHSKFSVSRNLVFALILITYLDRYMAPEVYRRESYGKSVDVFSFALIVHEVTISKVYVQLII